MKSDVCGVSGRLLSSSKHLFVTAYFGQSRLQQNSFLKLIFLKCFDNEISLFDNTEI